jgi:hypothetical protein
MWKRRLVLLVWLLLGVGLAYFLWPAMERAEESRDAGSTVSSASTRGLADSRLPPTAEQTRRAFVRSPAPGAVGSGATLPYVEADFPIAAPLNAPGSTITRDLDIVSQIFDAWQSNFPREGNPVGENAEITAALLGDNRLGLALIHQGHRAVNERGELCDRWGTPFRFHQLSGTQMEIFSAGPDRKFATADDAVWTPQ